MNATQGLDIVWNFEELAENSVRVRLTYEFTPRVVIGGRLLAALVLGELFVHNLAEKTLAGLKRKMEVRLTPAAAVSLPPAEASVCSCAGQANSAAYFFSSTCLGIESPLYRSRKSFAADGGPICDRRGLRSESSSGNCALGAFPARSTWQTDGLRAGARWSVY